MKSKEQITKEIREIALEFSQTKQKPYLSILQPRRSFKETPAQQLKDWGGRMINTSSFSTSYHAVDGTPVDLARCYLIEKAIEDDSKYALFIDEDTVLPYYGLMNLIKTSEQYPNAIINGIYYVKFGNPMVTVMDESNRWVVPDVTPNSGLIRDVTSVGLGCTLIPLHIIHKLKKEFKDIPLFCIVPEKLWGDENIKFIGEDTWFYNLVRKLGIEIIADTSVQCLHMELKTGKYSSHPDINLDDYFTNIKISDRLTTSDRSRVSQDYIDRTCTLPEFNKENKE